MGRGRTESFHGFRGIAEGDEKWRWAANIGGWRGGSGSFIVVELKGNGRGVLGVSSMMRAARDKEDGRGPHCCPAWEGGEGEEEEAS